MIDQIELHREEVGAFSRRFRVRRLGLFGSAARGDSEPEESDIDFLVEFDCRHAHAPAWYAAHHLPTSARFLLTDVKTTGAIDVLPDSNRKL